MSTSPAFEWVADRLEGLCSLSRIESRGTLRLVLKEAGLDPNNVTVYQLKIVIEKILPESLRKRGITNSSTHCVALANELLTANIKEASSVTPEEIFRRLGRR